MHQAPRIWGILVLAWYLKCSSKNSFFFLHPPYAIQSAELYTLVCHPVVPARTISSLTNIFNSFEVSRVKGSSKSIWGICGLIDICQEHHTEAKAFVYPRISLNNSTKFNVNWLIINEDTGLLIYSLKLDWFHSDKPEFEGNIHPWYAIIS